MGNHGQEFVLQPVRGLGLSPGRISLIRQVLSLHGADDQLLVHVSKLVQQRLPIGRMAASPDCGLGTRRSRRETCHPPTSPGGGYASTGLGGREFGRGAHRIGGQKPMMVPRKLSPTVRPLEFTS